MDKSEQGFSYIDVMCAVVILLVGILALVSAITGAVFQSKGQELQLNAKQIATSAIESIMSVKETSDLDRLGWDAIGNVGSNPVNSVNRGIFVTGFQPVRVGTGADQIIGTADDNGAYVDGYERRIVIRDECDIERPSFNCPTPGGFPVRMRSIEVTVTYYVGMIQRQEVITTVLTDYAPTE